MSTSQSKEKKPTAPYSAQQRCQAVLSIWTERRKAAALAKELGIPTGLLYQWQERAMDGMLGALAPRSTAQQPAPLASKLEKLLERKALPKQGKIAKMRERLMKIQQDKQPS